MDSSTPGQFDFSQQRRTFHLELARSVPQGLLTTAFMTFVIFIAIRYFNLPPWQKGAILGSSSIGLLLSLFVVQLIRRLSWPVNRMAAGLWALSSLGFLLAAFSAGQPWVYVGGVCFAFIALGAGMPLMAQIYRKHYTDEGRGRLFSISSFTRMAVVALSGWAFGIWLQHGSYQGLFVIYAVSCVVMAACVLAMAPVRLRASNRIQWFDAMRHVRTDRPFRKLLVAWMYLGFGNLIAIALFVEYIGNPKYGFGLSADRTGLITSTIPMIAAMVTVMPWGSIFDRVPFYSLRAIINLIFMAGILVYFLGGSITALIIGIALHGVARAGGEILWSLWTTRFADGERVAEYQSVHSFMTGVRGLLSPFIAFAVVSAAGPVTVAWISCALMLYSSLMILPEILAEWRGRRGGPLGVLRSWRRRRRRAVTGDFIVNDEHWVVYQSMPKVACSTWKNIMARLEGVEVENPSMLHQQKQSGLHHVTRPSATQLQNWNRDYFTFTFIRSPWSRVLSAYLDKVESKFELDPGTSSFAAFAQKYRLDSFKAFVDHLAECDPADMNPHWAPQSSLLMRDRLDYDFIGKFENMAEDARKVLDRLGISESLEELSQTPHQKNADSRLAEVYTPELIEAVGRIYAEDVELGGYQPPQL